MTFAIAVMIAVQFWGARNVPITCPLTAVVVVDETQMPEVPGSFAVAAAFGPGNPRCGVIQLSPYAQGLRTTDPAQYCAVIVHEAGHVGGLQHTETGIMSPGVAPADYPSSCRLAARRERVRNQRRKDTTHVHR